MSFGNRLLYVLEDKNITQKQFSEILNIAPSTINGYINNYREPDFSILKKISTILEVSTDYLLGLTNHSQIRSPEQLTDIEAEFVNTFRLLNNEQRELIIEQGKLMCKQNTKKDIK